MSIASELAALPHPRLLFVRLDNIGDVVLLEPALRAVREALPGCAVTLWTTRAGAQAIPLLGGINDVVVSRPVWQEVGTVPSSPENDRRLILALRDRAFHAAFIFTSYSQTPHPAAVACSLAGIPRRVGSSYQEAGGGLLFETAPPPLATHQAERNLRLLEETGFFVGDRSLRLQTPAEEPEKSAGGDYLVVSPWASCPARSYPAGRMLDAAVATAAGRGLPIYLVGRDSEKDAAASLLSAPRSSARAPQRAPIVNLVGRTTVTELAALIARARLVFCNNTLAMHLADGTRTPIVVAYAGTDLDSQWAPRHAPHRLLQRDTECAPCFLLTCPCGHRCLDIPAHEMAAEAEALLTATGARMAQGVARSGGDRPDLGAGGSADPASPSRRPPSEERPLGKAPGGGRLVAGAERRAFPAGIERRGRARPPLSEARHGLRRR